MGKILAVSSLMPMAIVAGFLTLIIFRRDLHTVRMQEPVRVFRWDKDNRIILDSDSGCLFSDKLFLGIFTQRSNQHGP